MGVILEIVKKNQKQQKKTDALQRNDHFKKNPWIQGIAPGQVWHISDKHLFSHQMYICCIQGRTDIFLADSSSTSNVN